MKKLGFNLFVVIYFVMFFAWPVFADQITIDDIENNTTPKACFQDIDSNFSELYGKWTGLGAAYDTSAELSALFSGKQDADADLTTWASVTPSANGQALVSATDYTAMRTALDLEAGTDFYSKTSEDTWRNSVDQTEMGHLDGVTSDIQTQLNARALESVVGTSIGNGLRLDGSVLKSDREFRKLNLTTDTNISEAQILDYRFISNQGDDGEADLTLPAVSYPIVVIFMVEEAQNIEINPPTGESFDLNGEVLDANDCVDSNSTVGSKIVATRMQNAAATWLWSMDTVRGAWTDTGASD